MRDDRTNTEDRATQPMEAGRLSFAITTHLLAYRLHRADTIATRAVKKVYGIKRATSNVKQ